METQWRVRAFCSYPFLTVKEFLNYKLLLINRARGPYWENIALSLSGMDRANGGPYKKEYLDLHAPHSFNAIFRFYVKKAMYRIARDENILL